MKKKVLVIFGTRPEAIKMCPVIKVLKKSPKLKTIVCVTGQHKEMLDQVLTIFDVIPDYNLAIMKPNQSLFDITENILIKIQTVLKMERPDLVLVHGDTTTTFVAALSSFYLNIPVGHVEAGLRTYNIRAPFPEEFNRQATGIIARLNFAPTELAKKNLLKEGKHKNSIYITGNTAIDALKYTVNETYSHKELDWASDSKLVLLTAHRRENLGQPMKNMFRAIRRILEENKDIKVIYPIHLNPQIRTLAQEVFKGLERIHLIEPLDVLDFHNFLSRAYIILTDSGGIQEEAPSLDKPVLVMRETTERVEGLEAGTLQLVGTSEESIYCKFKELIRNSDKYRRMSSANNPYGDGFASERIVEIIEEYFELNGTCNGE